MKTARTLNERKKTVRVGSRVRFPYGAGEVEAIVIEDRGNLGVGGRRIMRVRIVGESDWPEGAGETNPENGSFELPAEELTPI